METHETNILLDRKAETDGFEDTKILWCIILMETVEFCHLFMYMIGRTIGVLIERKWQYMEYSWVLYQYEIETTVTLHHEYHNFADPTVQNYRFMANVNHTAGNFAKLGKKIIISVWLMINLKSRFLVVYASTFILVFVIVLW